MTINRDYIGNPRGHVWELNDEGAVNLFGMDAEPHNGPRCVICGYSFCEHCGASSLHDCPGEDA